MKKRGLPSNTLAFIILGVVVLVSVVGLWYSQTGGKAIAPPTLVLVSNEKINEKTQCLPGYRPPVYDDNVITQGADFCKMFTFDDPNKIVQSIQVGGFVRGSLGTIIARVYDEDNGKPGKLLGQGKKAVRSGRWQLLNIPLKTQVITSNNFFACLTREQPGVSFVACSQGPGTDTLYYGGQLRQSGRQYAIRVMVGKAVPTCTDSDGPNDFTRATSTVTEISQFAYWNPFKKGTVTENSQYTNWQPKTYSDVCTEARPGWLEEGVCERRAGVDYTTRMYYNCPNGCKDGACLKYSGPCQVNGLCDKGESYASCPADCAKNPSCTDSDAGQNYDVAGYVTGVYKSSSGQEGQYNFNDQCYDDAVNEWYCDGPYVRGERHTCSTGCKDGACVAAGNRCTNGVKDGDETGVDCGGNVCGKCDIRVGCFVDSDCLSNVCHQTAKVCVPDNRANCVNGVKDGDETDVDCGGTVCRVCDNGQSCIATSDCASNFCDPMKKCAQYRTPKLADHLFCYYGQREPLGRSATLFDAIGAHPGLIDTWVKFCNPAVKLLNNTQILPQYTDDHYRCYTYFENPSLRAEGITLVDQFGVHTLFNTTGVTELCAHAKKTGITYYDNPLPLAPVSGRLYSEHLSCYQLNQVQPAARTVFVQDEFSNTTRTVQVNSLLKYCTSATKVLGTNVTGEAPARQDFLCYGVNQDPVAFKVRSTDQFGEKNSQLLIQAELCVPARVRP